MKELLDPLTGRWHLAMTTAPADGPSTHADGLRAEKRWVGDGRYVREEITGDFAGKRHEKLTLFGYNSTRDRFEYMTADNNDGVILLFTTLPAQAGDGREIVLFADYAMPDGEHEAPRFITIRTTLLIESHDRHVLRNAYRYAGGVEKPFLEYVYTREGSVT